jgi:SAM-dependent methyltransferase
MDYITKHCLFCGNQEKIKELYPQSFTEKDLTPAVFSARRSADQLHYRIVRCQNCGLVFSQEVLPSEILEKLYSQSKVTYGKYTDIIREDYWRALKPFLNKIDKKKALEIGCGNGFFLEELLGQGFQEVCGCEPSTAAIAMASPRVKENITADMFREGLYDKNSFDLICSFQTLDHLADPVKTIKLCYDLLKPQGLAFFVTHNVDSLQAKLLREKSPIIDVEHIYLFNKNTLSELFKKEGFEKLKVIKIKNSYPLNYWLEMLALNKLNQILNILKIGSIRLPIAAGNIGIVAKK